MSTNQNPLVRGYIAEPLLFVLPLFHVHCFLVYRYRALGGRAACACIDVSSDLFGLRRLISESL